MSRPKKIKFAVVDYIKSGTFIGGEEDISNANLDTDGDCVVIKQTDFDALREKAWMYDDLCK